VAALSFCDVRALTEELAAPLSPEDQAIQSMADVSPTKWHRAHTTWFFETFLLETSLPSYRHFDDNYRYLFNSYYEGVGPRHARNERGLLTRPGAKEIGDYRHHVDDNMHVLLERIGEDLDVAPGRDVALSLDRMHAVLVELHVGGIDDHVGV